MPKLCWPVVPQSHFSPTSCPPASETAKAIHAMTDLAITTLAPLATETPAVRAPIPLVLPVMTAALPSRTPKSPSHFRSASEVLLHHFKLFISMAEATTCRQ